MKVVDLPAEVRRVFDQLRWNPFLERHDHPADGDVWFPADRKQCQMCGGDRGRRGFARDHCHITGLFRGLLCTACNLAEGRMAGLEWDLWREHAPFLEQRLLEDTNVRSPYLTDDEVLSLPMAVLFDLHAERSLEARRQSMAAYGPTIDKAMAELLGNLGRAS